MHRTPLQSSSYLHQQMELRHLTSPFYLNSLSSNPEQFKRLSMVGAPSSNEHPLVKQGKRSPFRSAEVFCSQPALFRNEGPALAPVQDLNKFQRL